VSFPPEFEIQAVRANLNLTRAEIRVRFEAILDHASPLRDRQLASILVVAIDDGPNGSRSVARREQQRFRGEVLVHRVVKIEMIARKIREDSRVKVQAGYAPKRKSVRGDFHCRVRAAPLAKLVQQAKDVQRFRRGIERGQDLIGQPVFDSPNQSRGLAGRAQNGVEQKPRGGLPVCAGDAGEGDRLIRCVIKIPGRLSEGLPAVVHLEPQTSEALRGRIFAQYGDRATLHCGVREIPAIRLRAGESKKEKTRTDPPRIVIEARYYL